MRNIEFVSYSGEFPTLCMGKLRISVDGEERVVDCTLLSGGGVYFKPDYSDVKVKKDPWRIDFYDDFFTEEEQEYILDLVNKNVEHGCCGGCI